MSKSSALSKCRSSWLADEVTISSFDPFGISMPPMVVSSVTSRRHAATEPEWRRHSSTAFGIRLGSAQISSHTLRFSSSRRKALAEALAVVSCAATIPAIIIECRYESVTTSGCSCWTRMPNGIQPWPDGSLRIFSSTVPAYCQNLPTASATATCSSTAGRPHVLTVCAIE